MLRRSKRIQGRQRVQLVLKEGDRRKGRSLVMLKKSNGLDNHCFGIVVSKKIHKSAVKRNRLRRQLYEAIRILEKDAVVPNPPPSDIVLLARGPLLEMDFSEIMRAVRELFTPSNV